jgi:hypothetical protein
MEQVPRGFWAKTVSRLSVNHVWTALDPFYEKVGVLILDESDTPGFAGGLMSVTAPRAGVLAWGLSLSF